MERLWRAGADEPKTFQRLRRYSHLRLDILFLEPSQVQSSALKTRLPYVMSSIAPSDVVQSFPTVSSTANGSERDRPQLRLSEQEDWRRESERGEWYIYLLYASSSRS